MSRQHMYLCNITIRRNRVLVYSESLEIRKVRTQVAHVLENVDVVGIARDGFGGFKRRVWDKRTCSTGETVAWDRIDLRQEGCLAGCGGTGIRAIGNGVQIIWS